MYENYFKNIGKYFSRVQSLTNIFQLWGYKSLFVPILDEYSSYKPIADLLPKNSFKVLNTNGTLLLLRPDATLFLAKMLGSHFSNTKMPLRLCYATSILNPNSNDDERELLQSGIELIGVDSLAGDLEIITIIHTALSYLSLPYYRIHIGSCKVIDALFFSKFSSKNKEILSLKKSLYSALEKRDHIYIAKILGKPIASLVLAITQPHQSALWTRKLTNNLQKKYHVIYNEYITLVKSLAKILGEKTISYDLSEIGSHRYYTGTVFSIYLDKCPSIIAKGGRYDTLPKRFGIQSSAVGGTIFPDTFLDHLISHPVQSTLPHLSLFTQFKEEISHLIKPKKILQKNFPYLDTLSKKIKSLHNKESL